MPFVMLLLAMLFALHANGDSVSIVNIQLEAVKDVYANQAFPNTNYDGSRKDFFVRSYKDKNIRAFVEFNLSGIPPGSYVTFARLFLFVYDAPSMTRTYECHRVTAHWEEGTLTWNNQPGYVASPAVTASISTTPNVWVSWDVKEWVQKFVAGDSTAMNNYGWCIKDKTEDSTTSQETGFWSGEYGDPNYRPTLTLSFYPPHLELELSSSNLVAGNWVKMTVHRKDYNNQPVTRGNLKVTLSSTSTSPKKKFSLTQGGSPISELMIEDGSSKRDFWYYDEMVGTWTINVKTWDYVQMVKVGILIVPVPIYGDDSEQLTVTHGPLDRFEFDTIPSPKTAAEPFSITILAKDAYGNTVTSYTGTNALSDTTGTISPTVTGNFVNGIWSGMVTINSVASGVKITTAGGGKSGESNVFDVKAGPPKKVAISPPEFTVAAGVQYSSLTISLRDAHDFETTSLLPVNIVLSTTSPDGEFREVGSNIKVIGITIPAGSSSAKLDYYDIRGGTWTITASSTGLTSGVATVVVIPDTNPPVSTISVGPPKYQGETTFYVTGDATFTISATDDASGVLETKYRIDSGSWNTYTENFTIAGYSDGVHTLGFYSSDKAGNIEGEKSMVVFLDNTGPSIREAEPTGTLVARSTSVGFKAVVGDVGSGIASVNLVLDGTLEGPMSMLSVHDDGLIYTKTITLSPGQHVWLIAATDNLGNMAPRELIEFTLIIDDQPPNIGTIIISPSAPVWMEVVEVSVSISDTLSGVSQAYLYFSSDGGVKWDSVTMTLQAGWYQGSIPGQSPMARVQYYIEASDGLGNVAKSPVQEFTVGIPLWVYVVVVGGVAVLLVFAVLRSRKRPKPEILPPPPPPP